MTEIKDKKKYHNMEWAFANVNMIFYADDIR